MHPITSTHLTSVRHQDYEAIARRHHAGRLDRTPRARSTRIRPSGARSGWFAFLTTARRRIRPSASPATVSC